MDKNTLIIPERFLNDPRLTLVKHSRSPLGKGAQADYSRRGELMHVIDPVCALRREPHLQAACDSQLLFGEEVIIHKISAEWCWGQSVLDHYVGWLPRKSLSRGATYATHGVVSRGSFLYRDADLKSQPLMKLPMAARLNVTQTAENCGSLYLKTDYGWLFAKHAEPLATHKPDFVSIAEQLQGTPYLWAGRSSFGLDCSGLVQLAMQMAGYRVLRDCDMQEASIGSAFDGEPAFDQLERGDLVFWRGHVGIMRDNERLLHANGHSMTVLSEPLCSAINRIAYLYGRPTTTRRLCAKKD